MRRPREIESPEDLRECLERVGHLRDVVIQGVDLGAVEADWEVVDVRRAVFIACPMPSPEVALTLQRRGATVIPDLRDDRPYSVYPSHLYSYETLAGTGADAAIERWAAERPDPMEPVEAIAQRLHDTAMTEAIFEVVRPEEGERRRVVGVMGGHAVRRDSPVYAAVALLGYELTRAGCFVATGGGPGIMEAANLGAYLTRPGPESEGEGDALSAALAVLARAPSVEHPGYSDVAEEIHAARADSPGGESLAIPTWLYAHEPVGRFATHIAKYFANSIREDGLLRLANHGIVFAQGGGGTIQEVFQDAAINGYAAPAERVPMIFLGTKFFTDNGVWDVMRGQAAVAAPPYSELLTLTDDVAEAVAAVKARA